MSDVATGEPGTSYARGSGSLAIPALWIAAARTVAFTLTLFLPLLLVRRLDQTGYGIYKQSFLLLSTALNILPLGFHMTAFYFLPRESSRKGQVVLNILLFHACAAGLGCLVLVAYPDLLSHIFSSSDLVSYAPLLGLVILLWVTASPLEYIAIADQQPRLATVFIVAGQITFTLLMLGAAILFGSLQALLTATAIQGAIQTTILTVYLARRFKAFSVGFDWTLTRTQIAYAVPLGLAGLIWSLQLQIHHYFVSNRFDAATYAIYAVGIFQMPLIGILSDSVGSVMIARVSQLQKEDRPGEILRLTVRMVRKLAAAYLPIYAFMLIIGHEFIMLLFTSRYLDSWPIFVVNLTMIPLGMVSSAFDPIMRAYPVHRYYLLRTRTIVLFFLIVALWFGTDRFGPVGVITMVVVANAVERLFIGLKAANILGASWRDLVLLRDVGKLGVAAFLALVVTAVARSFLLNTGPFAVLAVGALLFGAVYLTGVWLIGVPTADERAMFFSRVAGMYRLASRVARAGSST